jgi:branched-chain amino acid aminotransferase
MNLICVNGQFLPDDQPVLFADDRSYRYGDAVFETMKWINGKIPLVDYHFERLWKSLAALQYHMPGHFTKDSLLDDISKLVRKNKQDDGARIRLTVSGGRGGLYDSDGKISWLIESSLLPNDHDTLNENGLVIGIYSGSKKITGQLSNLKTASSLLYTVAAQHAKENKWNDVVLLNQHDRVADTTIANLFIVKDKIIYTPSLEEGCVAGVLRQVLLEKLHEQQYQVIEKPLAEPDLAAADEMFVTNSIRGLRWVQRLEEKTYRCETIQKIYREIGQTIFK